MFSYITVKVKSYFLVSEKYCCCYWEKRAWSIGANSFNINECSLQWTWWFCCNTLFPSTGLWITVVCGSWRRSDRELVGTEETQKISVCLSVCLSTQLHNIYVHKVEYILYWIIIEIKRGMQLYGQPYILFLFIYPLFLFLFFLFCMYLFLDVFYVLSFFSRQPSPLSCLGNQMSELLWNRSWWPAQSF